MNPNTNQGNESDKIHRILQYRQTRCNDIATALIREYEPLVQMAAGKMSRSRPDLYEDMHQVGQISLIGLFDRYDAESNVPFEAYAMKCLIGHMKNYLRDKSWYVHVPRRVKEKGAQLQQTIDELTVSLERSPSVGEIAASMELSVEETVEVMAGRESYGYVSLDMPQSADGNVTIGDQLGSGTNDYLLIENRLDLEMAFSRLMEEERKVLALIVRDGQSQRSVAQALNISQMSVSRIRRRALDKLKQMLQNPQEEPDV